MTAPCAVYHGDDYVSCVGVRAQFGVVPFSIVLDLNVAEGWTQTIWSGETPRQRLGSCKERHVYDPFTGTCLEVTCSPGHSFTDDGQCRSRPIDVQENVHNNSGRIYRSNSTTTSDVDCTWIKLNSSEYRLLSSGSIYVHAHEATYDVYRLDANNTAAYVCTSFQRNFTKWVMPEALRVDSVGVYLSLVCSVVSLLALAFQFAVYMAFPVLRNTPGRCIVCLVVSLFVGQLLFLLVKTGSFVSQWFCFGQPALMHLAFMAAFLWMNVFAMDVYRTFNGNQALVASSSAGARRRFARYSAYAWTTAAVLVGVGVTLDLAGIGATYRPHYGYHQLCWFGNRSCCLACPSLPCWSSTLCYSP